VKSLLRSAINDSAKNLDQNPCKEFAIALFFYQWFSKNLLDITIPGTVSKSSFHCFFLAMIQQKISLTRLVVFAFEIPAMNQQKSA
jgi:hypothetical protein